MALSQNGWRLAPANRVSLPWVTGQVLAGDVYVIFDYFCKRFDAEVEKIRHEWSWGYNYRPIRGTSVPSNHGSATAIDLNAPVHPLGEWNTFSPKQQTALDKILADLNGVLRGGYRYKNRPDDMHFEIDADHTKVAVVARAIRSGALAPKPAWAPKTTATTLAKIQGQFQIIQKNRTGKIQRFNGIGLIQQALNDKAKARLTVDGYCGAATLAAWSKYEQSLPAAKKSGRPGTPDAKSLATLGIEAVGPEIKAATRAKTKAKTTK